MKIRANKGFSLLEILLVITLLSILFAILVIRVNPRNIIYITEDNQREADALTIYQALEQYAIKNNSYPDSIKDMLNDSSLYICKTSAPNCSSSNQINLSTILVPTYFSKIPEHSTDTNNSGFYVVKDINGKVGIGGVRRVDETTFVKGIESQSFSKVPLFIICNAPTTTGLLAWGVTANGVTVSIPYEGATGQAYSQQTLTSTGVTGLTATLAGGNFGNGSGNLIFNITGTPSGVGTANFNSTINGNTCSFVANSTTPPIVTNGLVLNLDAGNTSSYPGTGTTWNDLSGNGNNGTLLPSVGGPTYNSANGGTLSFDGLNDYISISNNSLLSFGTNSFTINFWLKRISTSSSSPIITSYNAYNSGWSTYFYAGIWNGVSGYNTGFTILTSGGYYITSLSAVPITNNDWINVSVTRSGNDITLYRNGSFYSTTSSSGNNWSGAGRPTLIGGGVSDTTPLNGNIAQVSIYNRALTPEEIQQNFNATRVRFGL